MFMVQQQGVAATTRRAATGGREGPPVPAVPELEAEPLMAGRDSPAAYIDRIKAGIQTAADLALRPPPTPSAEQQQLAFNTAAAHAALQRALVEAAKALDSFPSPTLLALASCCALALAGSRLDKDATAALVAVAKQGERPDGAWQPDPPCSGGAKTRWQCERGPEEPAEIFTTRCRFLGRRAAAAIRLWQRTSGGRSRTVLWAPKLPWLSPEQCRRLALAAGVRLEVATVLGAVQVPGLNRQHVDEGRANMVRAPRVRCCRRPQLPTYPAADKHPLARILPPARSRLRACYRWPTRQRWRRARMTMRRPCCVVWARGLRT